MPAKLRYKSGIYKIENLVNGKVYIGSASDFRRRFREHRCRLRQGVHTNKHLQSAWNRYGETSFSFEEFAYVPDEKEALTEAETEAIATMRAADRRFGYNMIDFGERKSGALGHRHTEEAKRKISEASIRNAHCMPRGEQSHKAKLKAADINVIRALSSAGYTKSVIGSLFGVTKQSIEAIVGGWSWLHVPHEDVDISAFKDVKKNARIRLAGPANPGSLLTEDQVKLAHCRELLTGDTRSRIAADLGVSLGVLTHALTSGEYEVCIARRKKDKMSWDAARTMRQMDTLGIPGPVLADEFRVSEQTVKDVVTGRTWREQA